MWANEVTEDPFIYKITPRQAWLAAVEAGTFKGAPVDLADGYIHFSTRAQVAETAAKHFASQDDLLLVAIPAAALGSKLVWEPSRGGALFPHLYASLDPALAAWARPMPWVKEADRTGGAHRIVFDA